MITIYKYCLTQPTTEFLDLPVGARLLRGGWCPIEGRLCFWALVDTDCALKRKVTVKAVLTGEETDAQVMTYLDTVRVDALVFHLFYFYN